MTERRYFEGRLAAYPEDKSLAQESIDNMSAHQLKRMLQTRNAENKKCELDSNTIGWIHETEGKFHEKIYGIYKTGNHKIKLTYYGMVYTILYYRGCYVKGKNGTPIDISHARYCSLLCLDERLGSKNVRKAIANPNSYGHNYELTIVSNREKKEKKDLGLLTRLEKIYEELTKEVERVLYICKE